MDDQMNSSELYEEYAYDSLFGLAEVFCMQDDEGGDPVKVLLVDGGFQSATYLGERRFDPVFAYSRAFDGMFASGRDVRNVLLIGGGAFSYPKHVLAHHPQVRMDVVEIDPVIIDAAYQHFYLDDAVRRFGGEPCDESPQPGAPGFDSWRWPCCQRLAVFGCDGIDFLPAAADASYDAVVNDTFGGTAQDAPLLSPAAFAQVKRVLTPGGIYVLNAVAEDEDGGQDEEALAQIRDALAAAFEFVREDACEDEDYTGCINHVFLASDAEL